MERLSEWFDRFELLFKNKQILEILGNLSNNGLYLLSCLSQVFKIKLEAVPN